MGPCALLPGSKALHDPLPADAVPLLPWRSQRRFIELKRLVDDQVVAPVVMARFSCHTDGTSLGLAAILYREFDLTEWLLGTPIDSITASIQGEAANVILRLADGTVCGVEAGATLPPGAAMLDRHELIARRGVASDRVVDTQVPQQSIYLFTPQGTQVFTDTDAELFGMGDDDIALVRSALDVLRHFDRDASQLRRQHARLVQLVRLAFQSDRLRKRLNVEGACPCDP